MLVENVTDEQIERWVDLVNAENNLSVYNDLSIDFFKKIKDFAHFYETEQYYLVLMTSKNMWGQLELNVVSWYIKPKFRNSRYILEVQRLINNVAKTLKCRYIIQGSHLNDELFNLLLKDGYKMSSVRKEIK